MPGFAQEELPVVAPLRGEADGLAQEAAVGGVPGDDRARREEHGAHEVVPESAALFADGGGEDAHAAVVVFLVAGVFGQLLDRVLDLGERLGDGRVDRLRREELMGATEHVQGAAVSGVHELRKSVADTVLLATFDERDYRIWG